MHRIYVFLIALSFSCAICTAQDKVIKANGDTVLAKILEVGLNGVSYKKANMLDGPTFVDLKSELRGVIFKNGYKETFTPASAPNQPANNISSGMANNFSATQNGKNKIEIVNGKYLINGQKASQKEVNSLLGKSNNPAVTLPLKAAKATKTAQKIVKITSIPTSFIGGNIAVLVSGIDLINDVRRTRDNTKTYVSFFSSVFTSISLPITNKILKNKSDKMYGKIIDAYNLTN